MHYISYILITKTQNIFHSIKLLKVLTLVLLQAVSVLLIDLTETLPGFAFFFSFFFLRFIADPEGLADC